MRRHLSALTFALVLALLVGGGIPGIAGSSCERIVAVGDLHGDAERFVATIRAAGLVDEELRWQGKDACLVQLGDVLDRGSEWPRIVRVLRSLAEEAPGRVHVLLGNHEAMNLVGDWRDVPGEDIARFAEDESAEERDAAFDRWSRARAARGLPAERETFSRTFPPGWFARRKAFSPAGEMGSWLLERPFVLRLQDTLFVHGGLTLEHSESRLSELNRRGRLELEAWLRFRDFLVEEDVLKPYLDYEETVSELAEWILPRSSNPEAWSEIPEDLRTSAAGLAVLERSLPLAQDGPLWNRSLAKDETPERAADLTTLLYRFGVRRIVVGHSPVRSGRIESRYDSRVFLIDTSRSNEGASSVSALVIEDGGVRALESEGERVLVAGDAEMERWLATSEVLSWEPAPAGITKPTVVTFEHAEGPLRALFKDVDEKKLGRSKERHFDSEPMFTDSFRYERAAYLLDRLLGLDLVPVAVLRTVGTSQGVLVQWVDGTMTEKTRIDEGLHPAEPMVLLEQREDMRVFDALILNTDRTLENQLTRVADWRLVPIDHSRSFRLSRKLPPGFEERPVRMSRRFFESLRQLRDEEVEELLGDLISKHQIRSLMKRRDRLLEKIEADIREFGESFVLLGPSEGEDE